MQPGAPNTTPEPWSITPDPLALVQDSPAEGVDRWRNGAKAVSKKALEVLPICQSAQYSADKFDRARCDDQ